MSRGIHEVALGGPKRRRRENYGNFRDPYVDTGDAIYPPCPLWNISRVTSHNNSYVKLKGVARETLSIYGPEIGLIWATKVQLLMIEGCARGELAGSWDGRGRGLMAYYLFFSALGG